jgi:tetratricopeptide (TPR) repeat protein
LFIYALCYFYIAQILCFRMKVGQVNNSTFMSISRLFGKQTYIFITIVITLCLLNACSSNDSATSEPQKPPVPPEVITEADALFQNREDIANLRDVIRQLGQARMRNQRSFDVEWRLARANYFLGRHSTDEKENTKALEDGKNAGKNAAKLEPNRPEGHFWFGANLGEQANRSSLAMGIKSVGEIRDAMNRVVEIQPDFELASAYGVLGQLELGTRLMGGDVAKAVEYLEKAVQLEKNNGDVRISLAEAYIAQKKDAEAKKQLEYLIQMKPLPGYGLEYAQQVAKARKMLETKF